MDIETLELRNRHRLAFKRLYRFAIGLKTKATKQDIIQDIDLIRDMLTEAEAMLDDPYYVDRLLKWMPPLHNPRREQFCQLLVQGLPASQAYVEVGYKPSRPAASRLQHDINISKRVRELMAEKARLHEESQRQAAQEAAIDKTWLIRQLKDAADIARRKDDPSGLVAAAREIGVLTGERIEKSEHGRPGEFAAIEAMSRAELEASIVKLVRQIEDDEPKLLAPPTDD